MTGATVCQFIFYFTPQSVFPSVVWTGKMAIYTSKHPQILANMAFIYSLNKQDQSVSGSLTSVALPNRITVSSFNPCNNALSCTQLFNKPKLIIYKYVDQTNAVSNHMYLSKHSPAVYFVLWINIYSTLHQCPHFVDVPDGWRLSQSLL